MLPHGAVAAASDSYPALTTTTWESLECETIEVVGVLSPQELKAAWRDLFLADFDSDQISVLAIEPNGSGGATENEIPEHGPSAGWFAAGVAARGASVCVVNAGLCAAIVAGGSSLAFKIAALLLVGAAETEIGGFLAHTIDRRHQRAIAADLVAGGMLVWAKAASADQRRRAIEILESHGARSVHFHSIGD